MSQSFLLVHILDDWGKGKPGTMLALGDAFPFTGKLRVCLYKEYAVVVKISANKLALNQTCGVLSKGESRCVRQTVFMACLHCCWRYVEAVPQHITLQQKQPHPTQSQTTGKVMQQFLSSQTRQPSASLGQAPVRCCPPGLPSSNHALLLSLKFPVVSRLGHSA